MGNRKFFFVGILMVVLSGMGAFLARNVTGQLQYFSFNDPNYPGQDAYTRCENARGGDPDRACCMYNESYVLANRCKIGGTLTETSAVGSYYPPSPYGQEGAKCGFMDAYPCCTGSPGMLLEEPNNYNAGNGFQYCYGQGGGSSYLFCVKGSESVGPYMQGGGAGKNGICMNECQASQAGVAGTPPQCKWMDGTPVTGSPSPVNIGDRCKLQQLPCCVGNSSLTVGGGTGPNDIMCPYSYVCDQVTGRCKDPYGTCGNGEREGSEMCDLGSGNFQGDPSSSYWPYPPPANPDENCTMMCMNRCPNGTCDAFECSTDTDPNSLYCASDCAALGQCGDGCDNDTDQFKNAKDPGCYVWDPVYEKNSGKDPHPQLMTTGGNESLDCPQPVSPPFEGPVGGGAMRPNSNNMCKPVYSYSLCSPPGGPGTQSSEPYSGYSDVVLWPSIETCCRAQANWVVTYLCDNSHDPAKTKEMTMNNGKLHPLCGSDVKEAIREEFVAICACENGGLSTAGSPKVRAIERLHRCAEEQCPDECYNRGANWKICGACMGAGGSEGGDNTKANACRTQAILECGGQTNVVSSISSSSAVSASSNSRTSASNSSRSARCGNGILDAGEACDAGAGNIPGDVADLPMNVVYLVLKNGSAQHNNKIYDNTHLAVLKTSRCLHNCTLAQCSDTSDNEPDAGSDRNDVGCHLPVVQTTVGAPYDCATLTTEYLPGRNSELDLCQENTSSSSRASSISSAPRSAVHESARSNSSNGLAPSSASRSSAPHSSASSATASNPGSTASMRSGSSVSSPVGSAVSNPSSSIFSLSSTSRSLNSATSISSSLRSAGSNASNSNSFRSAGSNASNSNSFRSAGSNASNSNSFRSAGSNASNPRTTSSAFSITRIIYTQTMLECPVDECAIGGSQFCALSGQTCTQTDALPCIRCAGGSSSSSSVGVCTGQECAIGGDLFCALSGSSCMVDSTTDQCFRCIPASSSSISSSSVSSAALWRSSVVADVPVLPAFCGNGIREEEEQCDNGENNANVPNACRPNCTLSRCGDGIIDTPLELCDDGNVKNGDGCSSLCQIERTAPQTLPAQIIELPFQQQAAGNPQPETRNQKPAAGNPQPATSPSSFIAPLPPKTADTGPAALAVMISGGAAGYAFMRRRR